MKNNSGVPVDVSGLVVRCAGDPEAKTDYDTGEVKTDRRSGKRLWVVGLLVRKKGDRKSAAVIDVTVAGDQAPGVVDGDVVRVFGLEASLWQQEGRVGLSYRAEEILPANAPSAPVSPPASGSAPVSRGAGKGGEA